MQNFNVIITDGATGECAVVDPAFEVDRLLAECASRHWKPVAVLLTHTHHDHVNGADEMVRATGARLYVGAGEVEAARQAAPTAAITGLSGGEKIAVGQSTIEALATPGHTVAGTSYLVAGAVMTGDTLFVGGCGRTDFPGGNPHILWSSLQKLAALPEETRVYPGHDYGATPTSTIAWECANNPYLVCKTEEEFIALRTRPRSKKP